MSDERQNMEDYIRSSQAAETRSRMVSGPHLGDGVICVWDHEEPLSLKVAALLRVHPYPFGWSVLVDAKQGGMR